MKISTCLSLTLLTFTSSFHLHGTTPENEAVRSLPNNVDLTRLSKRDIVHNEARSLPKTQGRDEFSVLMTKLWKNDLKMNWLSENKKSIEGKKGTKKLKSETKIKILLTLLASEISENHNDPKIKKLFALKSKSQANAKNVAANVTILNNPTGTQNQLANQPQQATVPLTVVKPDLAKQVQQVQTSQIQQIPQEQQVHQTLSQEQQAQPTQNKIIPVLNKVRSGSIFDLFAAFGKIKMQTDFVKGKRSEIPTTNNTSVFEKNPKSKKLTAIRKIKILLTLIASELTDPKVQAKFEKLLSKKKALKMSS